MMTVIIFLLVISLLIFVHELGHFLAAKLVGARVDEFAIGFPPRLLSKKYGETVYSLNSLPFGGYVKIYGENPDENTRQIEGEEHKGGDLSLKPKWQQALVLVAGVTFNVILAWLLISGSLMVGAPTQIADIETKYPQAVISDPALMIVQVSPNSPAETAGLMVGDVISELEVAGNTITSPTAASFMEQIVEGEELILSIERGSVVLNVKVVPEAGVISDKVAIGVGLDEIGLLKLPVHQALAVGAISTGHMLDSMVKSFGDLFKILIAGDKNITEVVAGPIGIASMTRDASQLGFVYLLTFTAFISLNLAVINMIPFPALDGGRLLVLLIEVIIRRPVPPKIVNSLNLIGLALLLILMIVISVGDVGRLL
ncbi:MAG: site-2 protease family protein [Candidatus Paceibacterota bacterium]